MSDTDSFQFDELKRAAPLANPFEQILSHMLMRIRSGSVPDGTRLPPERELSDDLQVSRATLRSVIRALQQSGYVRTERGRTGGSVVTWNDEPETTGYLSPSMKGHLLDQLVFRSVVESGAAYLAAARTQTEKQTAELERLLEDVATPGLLHPRAADAELHLYIAELSGSSSLVAAVAQAQLILNEPLTQLLPRIEPGLEHSIEQHAEIVRAIVEGEPEQAMRVMREHVEATSEIIRGFL